jgi:DNA-binding CsgD family transcriptional regulator
LALSAPSLPPRWQRPALAVLALVLLALMVAMEWLEEVEEFGWQDLLVELLEKGLLVATVLAAVLSVQGLRAQAERTSDLAARLEQVAARSEAWRQRSAVDFADLGRAIDEQLRAWGLTRAEREVAMLLLKGFDHKEIARLRATSDATVRQQAASIYRKAELDGRAALAAFFLEGLFLPEEPSPAPASAPAADRKVPGPRG